MRSLSVFLLIIYTGINTSTAQSAFKKKFSLMGCDFEITLSVENDQQAEKGFEMAIKEMSRIEMLISSWKPQSQTSEINRNAGKKAVVVSDELFDLIVRSIALSRITDGAFDITYASMDPVWYFNKEMTELPSKKTIEKSVALVGFEGIILDENAKSVLLKTEGMKIGFGAIGKGYAADMAKELLVQNGYDSGIINASGDVIAWGGQVDGSPWKVAITNPKAKDKAFGLLPVQDQAVVTSGDYEKYVVIDGKRYSHIIDPRTGYPARGISSVTVFANKAELADAMATAAFVMGVESALDRFNQINGLDCLIVDEEGNLHQSNGVNLNSLK